MEAWACLYPKMVLKFEILSGICLLWKLILSKFFNVRDKKDHYTWQIYLPLFLNFLDLPLKNAEKTVDSAL